MNRTTREITNMTFIIFLHKLCPVYQLSSVIFQPSIVIFFAF